MGPRKRSKPNPKADSTEVNRQTDPKITLRPEETSNSSSKSVDASSSEYKAGADKETSNGISNAPQTPKSWYCGTWPRGNKATPVTKVAKESISAVAGAASEAMTSAQAHTPSLPTNPLYSTLAYQRLGSSSRSLPLTAATTKLNVTSNAHDKKAEDSRPETDQNMDVRSSEDKTSNKAESHIPGNQDSSANASQDKAKTRVEPTSSESNESEKPSSNRESASWLTWFSRTEQAKALESNGSATAPKPKPPELDSIDQGATTSRNPGPTVKTTPTQAPDTVQTSNISAAASENRPNFWLKLWGHNQTLSRHESISCEIGTTEIATGELKSQTHDTGSIDHAKEFNATSLSQDQAGTAGIAETTKSSGWAFWSKDSSDKKPEENTDELALPDLPSIEKDSVDVAKGVPKKVGKRQRPQSSEASGETSKTEKAVNDPKVPKTSDFSSTSIKGKSANDSVIKSKKEPPNLLLPTFQSTYASVSRPGLIQQLSRWFPFVLPFANPKHADIVSSPPRLKRALVIGVHGYFPAPLVRSFLGQPTGTSIRFANSAANAIKAWTHSQGYSCEVEKVALEGEGKIAERIDLLWKLLLNWIDKIRMADFVFVACHSQGCPVAMILVAKLISFGCVSSARIGVCAMAGINLGPFIDYKTRWIGATALELFDFARHDSKVSKDYEEALDTVLKFGVKIVYVGSIDDQLVSLESSTFGTVNHPNIYRAVFIDGRVHAPDFLVHLVGFALKLRNLGISDHGLVRELSAPLAGSLYSGEGHSRIYEDEAVYYLAVENVLETTPLTSVSLQAQHEVGAPTQNPYILPFAMRGLLEENYVRTELYGEISELIRQFDDWKPSSKVLKDVKFRLEGVRSKL